MIDEKELTEKALKSVKGNPALEKQFAFFAPVIAETAPVMPDIWHGGGRTSGKDYKSIRFCWRNERNGRWIELAIYDSFAGSFFVNLGRETVKTSIKDLITYGVACAAFRSSFAAVFEG